MAEAGVTDEQIKKSNEPEFTGALEARDAAKQHSAAAPGEYRAQEQDVLAKGRADAEGAAAEQLAGMHGARGKSLGKALGKKEEAKAADEAKRAKVATDIQGIYDRAKADVTTRLEGLDGKVDAAFTAGEQEARTHFEAYVDEKMTAYKDERYDGISGAAAWAWDKLAGMPDEVNRFYEQGRVGYLAAMDGVINRVATIVSDELTAARVRIAEGRAEVQKYVLQLPDDLKEVGKEAQGKLEAEFDQLSSDVDSKQDALVDTLAQKYVESRDKLDSRIEELQAANKGLVGKALDAVVGVVKTILKLKDMLLNVLAKAADVIGDIISDPIGFLGNLISGVMGGLNKFVSNIGSHLKDGLMGWLFGALGSAGITMPKSLDFAGILDLVLQILGLTYKNVRARIAKAVGEPLMAKMEGTAGVLKDFATKDIAGAWEWIKDKIGDLEEMVLGQIKQYVSTSIIKAGITWIISLLNPVSAFIKACKAIYDIVMFIVERGSEIMEFVNSILDSIGAIAKGSIGVAVEKVEGALAKALPLAISFLASLLNLGGISEKIRSIIDAVRAPITKAIDFVVGGAVKAFKKMFGGAIGWAKGKLEKGKAYVKGKVEGAKSWATRKGAALAQAGLPEDPHERLALGKSAALTAVNRFSGRRVGAAVLRPLLGAIKFRYGFKWLDVVPGSGKWRVVGAINPDFDEESQVPTAEDGDKPDRFTKARADGRRALGRLRAYIGSAEVRAKLEGAQRGEFEAEFRTLDADAKKLEVDTSAAENDPELGDLAADEWDGLRVKVEELEGKVVRSVNPGAEGAEQVITKADSPIWRGFSPFRGQTKMSGAGGNRQYYEWDFTHGDIEVYNARGEHLGTKHAVTGAMIKSAVEGRVLGNLE
jgi:uncharacterized protein YdcH (DUF465 family)